MSNTTITMPHCCECNKSNRAFLARNRREFRKKSSFEFLIDSRTKWRRSEMNLSVLARTHTNKPFNACTWAPCDGFTYDLPQKKKLAREADTMTKTKQKDYLFENKLIKFTMNEKKKQRQSEMKWTFSLELWRMREKKKINLFSFEYAFTFLQWYLTVGVAE